MRQGRAGKAEVGAALPGRELAPHGRTAVGGRGGRGLAPPIKKPPEQTGGWRKTRGGYLMNILYSGVSWLASPSLPKRRYL